MSPATPNATATAAPAAAATPAAKVAAPETPLKAPKGYKLVKRDGETLFCHNTTPIGSRVPTTVCMTPDQYEESERTRARLNQELSRKQIALDDPP